MPVDQLVRTPDGRIAAHAAQHCANVAPPIASTWIGDSVNMHHIKKRDDMVERL
jgi:hypothetical protein